MGRAATEWELLAVVLGFAALLCLAVIRIGRSSSFFSLSLFPLTQAARWLGGIAVHRDLGFTHQQLLLLKTGCSFTQPQMDRNYLLVHGSFLSFWTIPSSALGVQPAFSLRCSCRLLAFSFGLPLLCFLWIEFCICFPLWKSKDLFLTTWPLLLISTSFWGSTKLTSCHVIQG